MKLKSAQKKGLSEFLNTIAAAWFSVGVISPIFIDSESISRTFTLAIASIFITLILVALSLQLLERVR